jgi:3-oxoacyl-[acyl-carrier protein] reductase
VDFLVKNFFTNKVILITGGSSGLGKTFVDFFLNKGAQVVVCSRSNKFKKKFYLNNKNFHYFKFDLHQLDKIKFFIKKVSGKFKKIDILINNAGIAMPKKIELLDNKNLLDSFKVNFFAPSLITKEVLKLMKKKNFGRIINISSGGAVNCVENYFSYSSSKAALNTLTKTLSKEIKNYDIKINSMSPGPCKTKMFPKNKLSTKLSLPTIEYLSSLNSKGPSGKFFWFLNEINIFPDLSHINWGDPKKLK